MVMELSLGGELNKQVAKYGKICEVKAHRYMTQIISDVKYLHEKGIVHRDLKLDNFLLSDTTDKALVKLIDFGLSTLIST